MLWLCNACAKGISYVQVAKLLSGGTMCLCVQF